MKKTIIAVILCLGLLVVFGAAAVGGEPAETGKKGAAVSYAEQDRIQAGGVTLGLDKGQTMAALIETVFGYDLRSYAYVSFAELWNGAGHSRDFDRHMRGNGGRRTNAGGVSLPGTGCLYHC